MINKTINFFRESRNLSLAIALISIASLSMAFIAEYGFGLKPCILCLYQRVPYALNIVFGFFAFMATYRYPKMVNLLIWVSVASFAIGGIIAAFHVGVEQHWWTNILAGCSGGDVLSSSSIDELRSLLQRQEIVRCDKPSFVLFGISMAGYNFLYSFGLVAVISFLKLTKGKDNAA